MFYNSKSIVAVISNQKQLSLLLKKNPSNKGCNNLFIDFSTGSFDKATLLEKAGFEKISRSDDYFVNQKEFIKEYITLIGDIGRKNNNRLWWASDISSKNPFASKLPIILEEYIFTLRIIDNKKYDYLIIYNPDWILLNFFKKLFYQRGDNFIYFDYRLILWFRLKFNIIKQITSNIRNALSTCFKIYLARKELNNFVKKKTYSKASHYVIKTFIFKGSFDINGNYKDIFFRSLPAYLKTNKNIIIIANIINDYRRNLKSIKQQSEYIILPLESFLLYTDVIISIFDLLFRKISIYNVKKFFSYDVTNLIRKEIKRTNMGISLYQYLHYNCMKNLSKRINIEEFLITYENNPWEKMSIMALREFSQQTLIIGYQHTIVAQAFVGSFISKYEKNIMPLPNKILTVGEVTKSILEEYGEYENNFIEPSCSLRYDYIENLSVFKRSRTGNILLALDGVPEIYRMVNYVIGELKNNPNYQLTIRPHPVFPIEKIKYRLEYDLDKISNVNISENSLIIDDLSSTDIVIYWGSTIALEAINTGIPVIHHNNCMKSFLSYDPLFQFDNFKWEVNNSDSLIDIIEGIYSMPDSKYDKEKHEAKKYISRYFHPITENRLNKFIIRNIEKYE